MSKKNNLSSKSNNFFEEYTYTNQPKDEGEVIDVTLIPEEHESGKHIHQLAEVINSKDKSIILALEDKYENNLKKSEIYTFRNKDIEKETYTKNLKSKRLQQQSMQDRRKYPDLTVFNNNKDEYKDMLERINPKKDNEVVIIGMDTKVDEVEKTDTIRDAAMHEEIKKYAQNKDVLTIVGSAHIYDNDDIKDLNKDNKDYTELEQQSIKKNDKKFGKLLYDDKQVNLTIRNSYPKDTFGYNTVNNDIKNFNKDKDYVKIDSDYNIIEIKNKKIAEEFIGKKRQSTLQPNIKEEVNEIMAKSEAKKYISQKTSNVNTVVQSNKKSRNNSPNISTPGG